MPMPQDDDEAAMKAVIDGMGDAARTFKAKRYAPKPKLGDEHDGKAAPGEMVDHVGGDDEPTGPTVEELAAMLGNGG